jgi:F0F1-type ATP synthase membrane subunit c/vacuolar-type H+-ATPase subunit K
VSSQGDQPLYEYLDKISKEAQGVLSPIRRAELVATLRQQIELERAKELSRSGRTRCSPDEITVRVLRRMGDPRSVVAGELRRNPPLPVTPSGAGFYDPDSAVGPSSATRSISEEGLMAAEDASWWRPPADGDPEMVIGRPAVPVGVAGTSRGSGNGRRGTSSQSMVSEARSPRLRQWQRMRLGAYTHEAVAIIVLVIGAVFSLPLLVFIGYVVALTSERWSANEKRTAIFGIPILLVFVYVLGLWSRAVGHWGGPRLSVRSLFQEIVFLVSTLPRMIGLLAALYFAWRVFRVRVAEQ